MLLALVLRSSVALAVGVQVARVGCGVALAGQYLGGAAQFAELLRLTRLDANL